MGCIVASLLSLIVNDNVKTEKYFKNNSFQVRFEFEASSHLASLFRQYFIIRTGLQEPREMPFSWFFNGIWGAKRVLKCLQLLTAVLAKALKATVCDFLTLLHVYHLGTAEGTVV